MLRLLPWTAAAVTATLIALPAAATAAPASAPSHRVIHTSVTTDNETPVLYDDDQGGNASGDDPAIGVDPQNSSNSLVLATAKEGGLRVYDMASRELQSLEATPFPHDGRFNNVDIAYDVRLGDRTVDLAVVSDRYNDTLRFFTIDPAGAEAASPLTEVTAPGNDWLFVGSEAELEEEHTAYGLTIWQPKSGGTYAVVTREGSTQLALARLVVSGDEVRYEVERTWTMPSTFTLPTGASWTPCDEPGTSPQFEGVVVDQRSGVLYAAQEDVGLWRLDLSKPERAPQLIDRVTNFGRPGTYDELTEECTYGPDPGFGGNITPDAEGLDILYGPGVTGQVILSAQGSDEFLLYDRKANNRYLGSFTVSGIGVDGINGSDGLAVTNRPVGRFTEGLLVTHDEPETGATVDPERDATNFSYVSWGDVARAFNLKINTSAKNDPRHK